MFSFRADNGPLCHWLLLLRALSDTRGGSALFEPGRGSRLCLATMDRVGTAGYGGQAVPSKCGIRVYHSANCLFLILQVSG